MTKETNEDIWADEDGWEDDEMKSMLDVWIDVGIIVQSFDDLYDDDDDKGDHKDLNKMNQWPGVTCRTHVVSVEADEEIWADEDSGEDDEMKEMLGDILRRMFCILYAHDYTEV